MVPTILFVLSRQGVRSLSPTLFWVSRAISTITAGVLTLIWMSEMEGDAEMHTGYGWAMVAQMTAALLAVASFAVARRQTASAHERQSAVPPFERERR